MSANTLEPSRLRDRFFNSLHEFDWTSRPARMAWLAATGLFLSVGLYNPLYYVLYKIVPGFNLFRVPARWLFLYAFGMAMLAGIALQRLSAQVVRASSPRGSAHTEELRGLIARTTGMVNLFAVTLLLITLGELFCAALALPFTHPTTPDAFDSLRTAPAYVLAAQQEQTAPGRFLGMSDIVFDPGDRAEMQAILSSTLSEQEIYDAIVSAKRKEVLAPNLPLAWQIPAVDGYGGGLLPLKRYALVQRLFLDEADLLADGRLGERLTRLPPSRLLSLLNTRFVLTDKVHDVWIDDVFYDLAFDANLAPAPRSEAEWVEGGRKSAPTIATDDLPHFVSTGLGIVSYLEGAASVPDGTPVAEIELETAAGDRISLALLAGTHTAEGLYGEGMAHTQARVGHTWRDQPEGSDYIARLDWTDPAQIVSIRITAHPFEGRLVVRGLSLVDERDGSSVPVLLSTDGRYRQVHSGDVKIYEVLDTLPRAYIVHRTVVEPDDEVALAAMRDPAYDPAQQAYLAAGKEIDVQPAAPPQVEIVAYAPEQVVVEATLDAPGYLILSDTWYPGWTARVDGEPAPIERANLTFRAVYLEAGRHEVTFAFQPRSYTWGLAISVASLVLVVAGMGYYWSKRTRN